MKRTILILLAALLLLSACTIRKTPEENKGPLLKETLKAPDHYEARYQSASGIATIQVDADVIVPEVSSIDILEAIPRSFSETDVKAVMDHFTGDEAWVPEFGALYNDTPIFSIDTLDFEPDFHGACFNFYAFADSRRIRSEYWLDAEGNLVYLPSLEYTWRLPRGSATADNPVPARVAVHPRAYALVVSDEETLETCGISREEARQMADTEMKALLPDFAVTFSGKTRSTFTDSGYYAFYYSRNIRGVPVNIHDCDVGGGTDEEYVAGSEVVHVAVSDYGIHHFLYENPTDPGDTVESDVKLLDFDRIMEIYAQAGPASLRDIETDDGVREVTQTIRSIRLGYMAVKQPDAPGVYYYTPVWDFYGDFRTNALNPDYPTHYTLSELTINAVTGDIIDRNVGY